MCNTNVIMHSQTSNVFLNLFARKEELVIVSLMCTDHIAYQALNLQEVCFHNSTVTNRIVLEQNYLKGNQTLTVHPLDAKATSEQSTG